MPTISLTLPRPHSAQRLVLDEAKRFNILACGRRWGKTTLGADRLARPALEGFPVGWFSPTYKMLGEVWRFYRRLLEPVTATKSEQDHRIDLITGGVIEFWSLDRPDVARGRKYQRVVIDEAAMVRGLEAAWLEVIRPTLADLLGDAWFLSTPKGFNFFKTLFDRGQDPRYPDYASWQMPTSTNPFIAAGEIEAMRQELTERAFEQEVVASFMADGAAVFLREWWQGKNRFNPAAPSAGTNQIIARYLSYDTALKDTDRADYTACTVGELTAEYRLRTREVWRRHLAFPDLVDAVQADMRRFIGDGLLRGVLIEDKGSGTSLIQTLGGAGQWSYPVPGSSSVHTVDLIAFAPTTSKAQRAQQASVWCKLGCVDFPAPSEHVPWLLDFERELFNFTGLPDEDEHDDQVDAFSQLVIYLEHLLAEGYHARNPITAPADPYGSPANTDRPPPALTSPPSPPSPPRTPAHAA